MRQGVAALSRHIGKRGIVQDAENEPWRPGERPDQPPTHPYAPLDPDQPPTRPYDPLDPDRSPSRNPNPITPDQEPVAPVREPTTPMPMTDPEPPEPTRLSR